MPGSPVDAKTHSRSAPSSLASSTMPPLPSVNPSGPRPASFSTTACKGHIDFFVPHKCGAHAWPFFCILIRHPYSFFKSDQWQSPFPADPECSALPTTAVQQRAIFLLFFITGEPAAASHLWSSPVEQAEALSDYTATVWQRHFPRDRRQRPEPCAGPRGRCFITWDNLASTWCICVAKCFLCPLEFNGNN